MKLRAKFSKEINGSIVYESPPNKKVVNGEECKDSVINQILKNT